MEIFDDDLKQDLINIHVNNYGLTPIAAHILLHIKSDLKGEGVTFDQLREKIDVSKGAISLNLKMLISKGMVIETNKFNERKRYFMINPEYVTMRIRESIEKLENELKTLTRMTDLIIAEKQEDTVFFKRMKIYEKLLNNMLQMLKETILKLETL